MRIHSAIIFCCFILQQIQFSQGGLIRIPRQTAQDLLSLFIDVPYDEFNRPSPMRPRESLDTTCVQNCLKTAEFNPVCGSDGVTYNNIGYLRCTQRCGLPDLRLMRIGNCPSTDDDSDTTTTPTIVDQTATNSSGPAYDRCLLNCPKTTEFNPVCGSDRETYDNINILRCAQRCGKTGLILLRNGRCPTR